MDEQNLGLCPKCQKGNIIVGEHGYVCDNVEDKCDFHIYKDMFSKELTPEIISQLLEFGETEVINDFTAQKTGKHFAAKLKLVGDEVKLEFEQEYLSTPCPFCGGKIKVTSFGYVCENNHKDDDTCNLFIASPLAKRDISKAEAEQIIKEGKSDFLEGFVSKTDKPFCAQLVLQADQTIYLNTKVDTCPICGGDLCMGQEFYFCRNFTDKEKQCKFTISRKIGGKDIDIDTVHELCKDRKTHKINGFKTKDGSPFDSCLIINEDGKVTYEKKE